MSDQRYYGTGKRKYAIARVWLISPGNGKITVNRKEIDEYISRETAKMIIREPLKLTDTEDKFDVLVNVRGGGISGQAGAIKHGISRALSVYNEEADLGLRDTLKKAGFLCRDSRIKERKKYGQRGARARYQYSKR